MTERKLLATKLTLAQLSRLERSMKAKRPRENRYLSKRDRLLEVIRKDDIVLRRAGITHEQIADCLFRLMLGRLEQGRGFGAEVEHFSLHSQGYMGIESCPFQLVDKTDVDGSSSDWSIANLRKGGGISFSSLHPHLIWAHHFFEGNVKYRLDPSEAIEVLGLRPGVDYSPGKEKVWRCNGYGPKGYLDQKEIDAGIRTATCVVKIRKGVLFHISGSSGILEIQSSTSLEDGEKLHDGLPFALHSYRTGGVLNASYAPFPWYGRLIKLERDFYRPVAGK